MRSLGWILCGALLESGCIQAAQSQSPAATAAAAAPIAHAAAVAAVLPPQAFGRDADVAHVRMSPDGKLLTELDTFLARYLKGEGTR